MIRQWRFHAQQAMQAPGKADAAGRVLLTVALCTRNRAALLERALRSVLGQVEDGVEVLVVDNGSTDGTGEVLTRLGCEAPGLRVVVEPIGGLSRARNRALHEAAGDYVVFLDDDAVAEPGWVRAYAGFLASPPTARLGALGGAVRPVYEQAPARWYPYRDTLCWGDETKRLEVAGAIWGGNSAYAKRAALEVGGFHEGLGRRGRSLRAHEEGELNRRLQRAGYEIWWLSGAGIRHTLAAERVRMRWLLRNMYGQGVSSAILRRMERGGERGWWRYRLGRVLVAPFQMVGLGLVAMVALPLPDRRHAARAFLRAVRVAGYAVQLLRPGAEGAFDASNSGSRS